MEQRIRPADNRASFHVSSQGTILELMKDKLESGGDAIKNLIKTGGDVADKMLDKGTDIATGMMNGMTGLISKLSDDIGAMANRILTMEERIGLMADRIVKTEELMAKLTATLAGKDFVLPSDKTEANGTSETVVISTDATEASKSIGPRLMITGDPRNYLLYVSTSPLFQDGSTVISRVSEVNEYERAWKRSMIAIRELAKNTSKDVEEATIVCIAVKTLAEDNQLSALSNSVDVRVHD